MKVYVLEMISEGGSIVYGVYKTYRSAELVALSQVGKSWPNYYITEQEIHGQQVTECIPDRKRKVKVPRSDESYYFKDKIDGKAYLTTVSVDPKNANGALFTDEELKQFGLDNDLFEKVEVQE